MGGASFLDVEAMMSPPSRTELADSENLLRIVRDLNLTLKKDWLRNWQQVQQQCTKIARLTAVDGALVMTFDRYVYSRKGETGRFGVRSSQPGLVHTQSRGP